MTDKLLQIKNMIYEIRGYQVMLDADIAKIYQVETKVLNQAVKRNAERFPPQFMFQLTQAECDNLKSQFVTSSWGGRRKLPYAFTEHGVIMLSSILNSKIAVQINITIVEAFIQLRHHVFSQNSTNEQITELRKLLMLHIEKSDYKFSEHDEAIEKIICALNNLIEKPKVVRKIGFRTDD